MPNDIQRTDSAKEGKEGKKGKKGKEEGRATLFLSESSVQFSFRNILGSQDTSLGRISCNKMSLSLRGHVRNVIECKRGEETGREDEEEEELKEKEEERLAQMPIPKTPLLPS